MSQGLIPKAFIQDLLSRLDIVDIVGRHIALQKRGQAHLACCPFHQEKTPSFNVNQKKQFYHCFGCGESGDAIAFLMAYERLSFVEAVEKLAQQAGVQVPHRVSESKDPLRTDKIALLNQVVKLYQAALRQNEPAKAYLKQRGLDDKVAHFKLGFAPPGWDNLLRQLPSSQQDLTATGMLIERDQGGHYDRFRNRIMFPIFNRQGDCIAFGGRVIDEGSPKYLNSPETTLFQKSYELYGLYQVLAQHRDVLDITIVEGYMDVLALVQQGYDRVVATLGTATTAQHLEILYRYTNTVIFCFDGDAAGRKAAWRALSHCCSVLQDGREAKFVFLDQEDDPDSFIRREGLAKWQQKVNAALSAGQFLFTQLRQDISIRTLEGRAKFAQKATPILKTIPSLTLQSLLLDELAKITRLDMATIRQYLEPAAIATPNTQPAPSRRYRSSLNRMQLACAFLLQHPELIKHIKHTHWLSRLDGVEANWLLQLVELLQEHEFSSAAQVLVNYQGEDTYQALSDLACYPLLCPESGIETEFKDLLLALRKSSVDVEIAELMQKAAENALSLNEKTLLQNLLRKRKSSKNNEIEFDL